MLEPLQAGCYGLINPPAQTSPQQMKRIALVVDDSMLIRHAVCRYFEDRGFAVESATNGQEALEVIGKIRPDIIVTDIQMPKLDGRQLIAALKSYPETAEIPIVVLAARNSCAETKADTRADHIIFKDIDIAGQLQQLLKSLLPDDLPEG